MRPYCHTPSLNELEWHILYDGLYLTYYIQIFNAPCMGLASQMYGCMHRTSILPNQVELTQRYNVCTVNFTNQNK